MAWPWVSRYRLEECERRLTAADAERVRLLDLLLEGGKDKRVVEPAPRRLEVVRPAPIEEDRGEQPEQGAPISFSTPFDRLESRFGKTFQNGAIPAKFKARTN